MSPNIDNKLGLTAVRKALNAREDKFPSTTCILEAVKICLKSNHSVFKENFFLQIHGTAMGPKNACSYANLAMGEIDLKAKFSGPIKPSYWRRYRINVFDLWQQGLPALHQFTNYINSLYPITKFELVFLSVSFTYLILLYILPMDLLRQTSIPNLQIVTYIFHLPAAILSMFSRLLLLE